jgi:hypothetical protein
MATTHTVFSPADLAAATDTVKGLRKGQSADVFGVEVHCYKRGWFAVGNNNGLKVLNAVMLIVHCSSMRAEGTRVADSRRV